MPGFESFPPEPNDSEQYSRSEQMELMETMQASLGFLQTQRMLELKQRIITDPMNVEKLFIEWRIEGEHVVESTNDEQAFLHAQIGLIVAQAAIYLELDMVDECYEELGSATEIAAYMNLQDIVDKILEIGSK